MTTSTGTAEEEELVLKNGATSMVWTWFEFKKSDVEHLQSVWSNLFHHLKSNMCLSVQRPRGCAEYSDPTNDLLDMASFTDPSYIADSRKDHIKTSAAAEIQA